MSSLGDLLGRIDWDFPDYISSQFPADLNSLHWYPASFVPAIPSMLIQATTKEGDLVVDPFCGGGTTLVEAARLRRQFVGVDLNPLAAEIVMGKFEALVLGESWFESEGRRLASILEQAVDPSEIFDLGVDAEVKQWFHEDTLVELASLYKFVVAGTESGYTVRKILLSSILNKVCSQREHYTYITDRCFPDTLTYRPAAQLFTAQWRAAGEAVVLFLRHHEHVHGCRFVEIPGSVICGDARSLPCELTTASANAVITSPPYLGVNDYVRSMRLTYLFFPSSLMRSAICAEIGARRKRQRKNAFDEFVVDMRKCFEEMARVIKPQGYLCLILGRGSGRVVRRDPVALGLKQLTDDYGFRLVARFERSIKFRRIQIRGVRAEHILVLQAPS